MATFGVILYNLKGRVSKLGEQDSLTKGPLGERIGTQGLIRSKRLEGGILRTYRIFQL